MRPRPRARKRIRMAPCTAPASVPRPEVSVVTRTSGVAIGLPHPFADLPPELAVLARWARLRNAGAAKHQRRQQVGDGIRDVRPRRPQQLHQATGRARPGDADDRVAQGQLAVCLHQLAFRHQRGHAAIEAIWKKTVRVPARNVTAHRWKRVRCPSAAATGIDPNRSARPRGLLRSGGVAVACGPPRPRPASRRADKG